MAVSVEEMEDHAFELIKKYAEELAALPGTNGEIRRILVNLNGRIYETAENCDLAHLRRADVNPVEGDGEAYAVERRLLVPSGEIKAVVLSKTRFCDIAARKFNTLTTALDDMAQIIGHRVETVEYAEKNIRKALKKSTCCFVKNRYTIATGRSLFEAVTALKVLEKSAEINVKAEAIGGAVPLHRVDAEKMRRNYRRNYSKSEAAVKAKEGRG